jgi:hypothetical protein
MQVGSFPTAFFVNMVSEIDRWIRDGSMEDFQSFVQRKPHVIREQCPDSGTLPLHRVLTFEYPILHRKKKLALLIDTYPEGLTIKDNKGRVPLHTATGADVPHLSQEDDSIEDDTYESMDLLAFVIKAFPAASQIRDLRGNTPLEYAIIKKTLSMPRTC